MQVPGVMLHALEAVKGVRHMLQVLEGCTLCAGDRGEKTTAQRWRRGSSNGDGKDS